MVKLRPSWRRKWKQTFHQKSSIMLQHFTSDWEICKKQRLKICLIILLVCPYVKYIYIFYNHDYNHAHLFYWVRVMVFNVTFNNISVILLWELFFFNFTDVIYIYFIIENNSWTYLFCLVSKKNHKYLFHVYRNCGALTKKTIILITNVQNLFKLILWKDSLNSDGLQFCQ